MENFSSKTPAARRAAPPQGGGLPAEWAFDLQFDGGDKACSELVMELRLFFQPLAAGTRVCVLARDPGAWIDIPAWCRLTGHGYIAEAPPYYLLERK